MTGEDLTPATITADVDASDAAALGPFCRSMAAFSQSAAALDPGVMYQGLAAVTRVAAAVQSGGTGFSLGSGWRATLTPLPSLGRSLLLIEGESQLHMQLDSANQCVGGAWADPAGMLGPGCAAFRVEGNVLLVENPSSCAVPLPGPVPGWTAVPVFTEEPLEGGSSILSPGMVAGAVGAIGAVAALAGLAHRAWKAKADQPPQASEKQWHYLRDGRTEGPVGEAALRKLLESMPPGTPVWNPGLPAWASAADVGLAPQPAPVETQVRETERWELAARSGPSMGRQYPLGANTRIGRETDNEIVLPDSMASRLHAVVVRKSDGWWLSDNHSSNGTFVDGVPVTQPVRLALGEVIRVGATELVVRTAASGH